jgi:CDP-glucose 4,6-dehydratase
VENLVSNTFAGRRVMITGHTGFTGAWMTTWLHDLGADVAGYALAPDRVSLFEQAGVGALCRSIVGDIRDREPLTRAMCEHRPSIVFHLAAQALVIDGFTDPVTTFDTNVVGTAALLDAVRMCPDVESVVVVTSDKCYEPTTGACVEGDRLGGHDPYSASKAAAELVVASYRTTWFDNDGPNVATARAGNIIGGGDWAANRLIPDCVRACASGGPLTLRHPRAIRPWQHVLDAVRGYLMIAAAMVTNGDAARAWNLGPNPFDSPTVADLVRTFLTQWPGTSTEVAIDESARAENPVLRLDANAIQSALGWRPALDAVEATAWAAQWYHRHHLGDDALALVRNDISRHTQRVGEPELAWAR